MVVEFSGLQPSEVFLVKLDNDKVIQSAMGGMGGQCAPSEIHVLIEKAPDATSPDLVQAVLTGTPLDYVIVHKNGAQFWLDNPLITSCTH